MRSLATAGADSVLPDILERSVDPDAVVRLATVDAIGSLGVQAEAASHAVGPLMHDRDPFVRAARRRHARADERRPRCRGDARELAAAEDDGVRAVDVPSDAGARGRTPRRRRARRHAGPGPRGARRGRPRRVDDRPDPGARRAHGGDRRRAANGRATPPPPGSATIGAPAVDPVIGSLASPSQRDGALAALDRLPLDGRSDDIREFAVGMVAEAVDRHRLGVAIDGRRRRPAASSEGLGDGPRRPRRVVRAARGGVARARGTR